MKKLYLVLLTACISCSVYATIIDVAVSNNVFTPSSFSATVGDTVRWTLVAGTHTSTSTSVPAGASSWNSGTMSTIGQQFSYKITEAGSYSYECIFHSSMGMTGSFTATSGGTGINDLNASSISYASPNPFQNKISVSYKNADALFIYNVTGRLIKTVQLSKIEGKVELDLSALPSGIYFYNLKNEGRVEETKRLIKSE